MSANSTSPKASKITIPHLPDSGTWTEADGKTFAFASHAGLMGFSHEYLQRYRKKDHPALGRRIVRVRKRFKRTQTNGRIVSYKYALYSLADLEQINLARKPSWNADD